MVAIIWSEENVCSLMIHFVDLLELEVGEMAWIAIMQLRVILHRCKQALTSDVLLPQLVRIPSSKRMYKFIRLGNRCFSNLYFKLDLLMIVIIISSYGIFFYYYFFFFFFF